LLTLAGENAAGAATLNLMDSSEFYYLLKAWNKRQQPLAEAQNKANQKR